MKEGNPKDKSADGKMVPERDISHEGSPGFTITELFALDLKAGLTTKTRGPANTAQSCLVIEQLNTSGEALMGRINDLIVQGNVHRIAIENSEGHTLLSVPTHLSSTDSSISAIPSSEAMAIQVIGAIVEYPRIIVERFA